MVLFRDQSAGATSGVRNGLPAPVVTAVFAMLAAVTAITVMTARTIPVVAVIRGKGQADGKSDCKAVQCVMMIVIAGTYAPYPARTYFAFVCVVFDVTPSVCVHTIAADQARFDNLVIGRAVTPFVLVAMVVLVNDAARCVVDDNPGVSFGGRVREIIQVLCSNGFGITHRLCRRFFGQHWCRKRCNHAR